MMWLMKIFSKGNKKKAGFTLIELMIVVIVVGILAAAAIPIYSRVMDRARASEGKALLGTVRTHYLAESAEGVTVTYATGNLSEWGIDTSKNRWWKVDPGDFTSSWGSPTFTITGVATDIAGIVLAINCDTGIFTETWPS
jgi:prepilin-type N-terminal cleavage/methylation domain-containing protein